MAGVFIRCCVNSKLAESFISSLMSGNACCSCNRFLPMEGGTWSFYTEGPHIELLTYCLQNWLKSEVDFIVPNCCPLFHLQPKLAILLFTNPKTGSIRRPLISYGYVPIGAVNPHPQQPQRGTRCCRCRTNRRRRVADHDGGDVTRSRFLPDQQRSQEFPAIPFFFLAPCRQRTSCLRVATSAARRVGSRPPHGGRHGVGGVSVSPSGPTPRPRDPPPPRATAGVAVHLSPFG